MEQLLVALLALSTALSASGSVLNGVASGPAYPQLIPYDVAYTNVHSPVVLSHLHGLRIDEALAAAGHRQAHAPAPIVETSTEEISNNNLITGQLYEQILRSQSGSEASNATEGGASSAGQSEPPLSPTVGELQLPQVGPESPAVPVSLVPTPISTAPSHQVRLPEAIPTKSGSEITINAEQGKLQMQASFVAGREGVQVTVGDVPQPDADSVSVTIPELPVSGTTKDSKSHGVANVNVNVNVNVNGDGTGSVINSTSVSEITAPIKTAGHKKCD